MKNFVKKFLILSIFCPFLVNMGHAFNLDETVDDEIRKNYNDMKLVNDSGINNTETKKVKIKSAAPEDDDLPDLPPITRQQQATTVKPDVLSNINTEPPKTQISNFKGNIKIKKGSTFYVSSSNAISDWQKKGTSIKFVLKKEVSGKNYKIPAWTTFNAEVVESHQPQITCNGGLVSIRVYSMTCKGQTYPINAYIIRANDKKIFLNDIKGQRTYLKTMWKKSGWGRSVFGKMMSLTVKLGSEGSTLLLSPFPALYGTLCVGLNALTSPITAFFSKGGHVSIPSGSQFKIKLQEDAFID